MGWGNVRWEFSDEGRRGGVLRKGVEARVRTETGPIRTRSQECYVGLVKTCTKPLKF